MANVHALRVTAGFKPDSALTARLGDDLALVVGPPRLKAAPKALPLAVTAAQISVVANFRVELDDPASMVAASDKVRRLRARLEARGEITTWHVAPRRVPEALCNDLLDDEPETDEGDGVDVTKRVGEKAGA